MLVEKEQKRKWERKQEEVFKKLKVVFTIEPILAISDIDRKIRVEVDASDYTTEEVLLIKYENRK